MPGLVVKKQPIQRKIRPLPGGGGIQNSANMTVTTREISSNGDILTTDEYLLIDATTDKSLEFVTPSMKRKYYLKITTGDGAVTLAGKDGKTIDGASSYIWSGDKASLGVLYDGSNYHTFLS